MAEMDPVVVAARAKVAQMKQEAITQRRLRVSARISDRFTKPIDRFVGISDQELRDMWDQADEATAAGDRIKVEGIGQVAKGDISAEIARREDEQKK